MLVLFIILGIVLFSAINWYFSKESENDLKRVIAIINSSDKLTSLTANLMSYNRSLTGAIANINIKLNDPLIANIFNAEAFNLNIILQNGPIFFHDSRISFGRSRWHIKIKDSENINKETDGSQKVFSKGFPEAIVQLMFDQKCRG